MKFFCIFIENIFEFLLLYYCYLRTLLRFWNLLWKNYFLVVKDKELFVLIISGIPLLFFIDSYIFLLFSCTLHIRQVILFDCLPLLNNKNYCRVHINPLPSMTVTLWHWNNYASLEFLSIFWTWSLLMLHLCIAHVPWFTRADLSGL